MAEAKKYKIKRYKKIKINSTNKSPYPMAKSIKSVKSRNWKHVKYKQKHVDSLRQNQKQVMLFPVNFVFQQKQSGKP